MSTVISKMDCQICCESLNKTTRKNVCCQYCNYSACRLCVQKYILDNSTIHCMNCKKIFTRDFIDSSFTKVFINSTLENHCKNITLNHQKSLLVETQQYVTQEIQKRKLKNEIKELNQKRTDLYIEINKINKDILKKERENRSIIVGLTADNFIIGEGDITIKSNKDNNIVHTKCPNNNCRGFLRNKNGKDELYCELCERHICKHCNELLENVFDEDGNRFHSCLPDNVLTMKLLKGDTKPCPNCSTYITKIPGGCDQMYCVNCHTAFSWNKGTIDKGIVHNPHYYEWLRQNSNGEIPRHPDDNPDNNCGFINNRRLPPYTIVLNIYNRLDKKIFTNDIRLIFSNIHQVISHIEQVELRVTDWQDVVNNVEFEKRIKYLLNDITEEQWKEELYNYRKYINKRTDFQNIYKMFVDVAIDIFVLFINTINGNNGSSSSNQKSFIDEQLLIIKNLVEYFNTSLEKIGKRYSCVYPGINKNYQWVSNLKRSLKN